MAVSFFSIANDNIIQDVFYCQNFHTKDKHSSYCQKINKQERQNDRSESTTIYLHDCNDHARILCHNVTLLRSKEKQTVRTVKIDDSSGTTHSRNTLSSANDFQVQRTRRRCWSIVKHIILCTRCNSVLVLTTKHTTQRQEGECKINCVRL